MPPHIHHATTFINVAHIGLNFCVPVKTHGLFETTHTDLSKEHVAIPFWLLSFCGLKAQPIDLWCTAQPELLAACQTIADHDAHTRLYGNFLWQTLNAYP